MHQGVLELGMSTRDEALFLLIYPNATKFVLRSIITVIETTCLKIWAKPLAKNTKVPFQLVHMYCLKISLL